MSVLGFLFTVFVVYLLYQVIFRFVLPIYRTTRQVKQGFREMQRRMEEQARQQAAQRPAGQQQAQTHPNDKMNSLGEYIDFEEVK